MKRMVGMAKIIVLLGILAFVCWYVVRLLSEQAILRKVIDRLLAESRIAQVLVTGVRVDPATQQVFTTIKFLEFDANGNPLPAKYFTFSGAIIQFQSMVIRFDDFYVKKGDPLKGKSAYVFMKAFSLKESGSEVFQINEAFEVPSGYKIEGLKSDFERKLWRKFWEYALNPKESKRAGIKNAQIEAPGTKFIPGFLYTITIEHDGGMRIDVQELPAILRGEKVQ